MFAFSATKAISSSGSTGTNPGVAGDGGVYKMDANTWLVTPFYFRWSGSIKFQIKAMV